MGSEIATFAFSPIGLFASVSFVNFAGLLGWTILLKRNQTRRKGG